MKVCSSHLEAEMVGLAGILCPTDFQRNSDGLPSEMAETSHIVLSAQSVGLPLDFRRTPNGLLSKKGARQC